MRAERRHLGIFFLLSIFLLTLIIPAGIAEGGQVSGLVWQEKTVDGVFSTGEGGVAGVKVTLERMDETGAARVAVNTTTDKSGEFVMPSLSAGTYRLRAEASSEYRYTLHGLDSAALPAQGNVSYSPWFSLAEGESLRKNIGLTKTQCTVSLIAFEDANANGGRMQTEPLVRGVQAELIYEYGGETYVVGAAVTDKEGQATLRELSPGTYRLRVILPDHYVVGPLGQKINTFYNCILPNEDNTGVSAPFTLAAKESIGMGVGMVRTGSLEGKIWFDANYNGKWDGDEAGLTEAVITLTSPSLGLTRTTEADNKGVYSFQGLQPGEYHLQFALPEGMVFTYPGASLLSDISSKGSLTVSVQVDVTTSLSPVGAMPAAGLSLTLTGADGEGPLSSASVSAAQGGKTVATAQTDENGAAVFHALRGGETILKVSLPDGWLFSPDGEGLFSLTGVQSEAQATVTLDGTEPDAAFTAAVTPVSSISGMLFEDAVNIGVYREDSVLLAGYTVQAVDENGEIAAEAVTGEDGAYTLSPLLGGAYTVRFLLDDTYVASPYAVGQGDRVNHILTQTPEYGETETFPLLPGQALDDVDGSVFRAGVVDGYVYLDEAYVPAETGMAGVTVTLLGQDGQPVSDYSYGVTDESGAFFIKGVLPGTYTLAYSLPENGQWTNTDTFGIHWISEEITTESGSQIHMPALHGMFTSAVAGVIQHGTDGDADFSAIVSLRGHTVNQVYEIRTLDDGVFAFRDLLPDTYTLTVTLPDGLVFGETEDGLIPATAASKASVEITLAMGDSVSDAQLRAIVPVSLSGLVYVDSNLSGTQEEDEYGVEGLSLSLWADGEQVQSITTDDSGSYCFSTLLPMAYELHIALDENERLAEESGAEQAGDEWILPLEINEVTRLALPVIRLGSVEGQVWSLDGSVHGVAGISVSLLDDQGTAIAAVQTDEQGGYAFGGLLPGDYRLAADLPQGYLFARAQDTTERDSYIQSLPDGSLDVLPFYMTMGDDLSGVDIGIGANGKIGDRAWLDENGNGMQDTNEPNMPGIEIALYQYGKLIASTVTDVYGRYSLSDLYPGEYDMVVTMHPELKTTVYQTDFPLVGSIMPESDETTVTVTGVTVPSGGENLHCDLGFQLRKKGVYPAAMDEIPVKDWRPYSER